MYFYPANKLDFLLGGYKYGKQIKRKTVARIGELLYGYALSIKVAQINLYSK